MLAVGQTVVYGTQGVCMVKEISMLKLGKTKGEYYVLSPIDDPGSTVYVPTASEKLANKLRPVLTGSEANALIDEAANEPLEWITSDNERKSVCDDIVKNGSRKHSCSLSECCIAVARRSRIRKSTSTMSMRSISKRPSACCTASWPMLWALPPTTSPSISAAGLPGAILDEKAIILYYI